jgi:hypothetical protein
MNKFFVTKNGEFIKCCWSGIDTRKMEQIVADMQKDEPDSEFKMYSWNGELTLFSILPIMVEKQVFREENWNWDKKYKPENLDDEEDWDIT